MAWGSRELGRCLAMALDTLASRPGSAGDTRVASGRSFLSLGLSLDIRIMRDCARRALGAWLAFRL